MSVTPSDVWFHIAGCLALGTPVRREQPMPTPGRQDVTPVARSLFLTLLEQREAKGIATYGTTLRTHNGRNVYLDLAEELIDAWQYAVQASIEHDDLIRENAALRAEVARLTGESS